MKLKMIYPDKMSHSRANVELKKRTHQFRLTHILHIYNLQHINQFFNCVAAEMIFLIHLTLPAGLKFDVSHSHFRGARSSPPDQLQFCSRLDRRLSSEAARSSLHFFHDYTNKLHCCAVHVQFSSACSYIFRYLVS